MSRSDDDWDFRWWIQLQEVYVRVVQISHRENYPTSVILYRTVFTVPRHELLSAGWFTFIQTVAESTCSTSWPIKCRNQSLILEWLILRRDWWHWEISAEISYRFQSHRRHRWTLIKSTETTLTTLFSSQRIKLQTVQDNSVKYTNFVRLLLSV